MTKKNNYVSVLILLLIFIFSLSSCKTQPEVSDDAVPEPAVPDQETLPETEESAYPIESGYPAGEIESGYPMPEAEINYKKGPDFNINEPVKAGDTSVTGKGPAGVPIELIDLSEIDLILAETIINKDGTFIFELDKPIEPNHSIGIKLGNISNTSLNEEDFHYNDSYFERPYVGILFDIVYVE